MFVGVGEVDGHDRGSMSDGIDAWPLAQGELQFVVHSRGRAAGAEGAGGGAVEDDGDGRSIDVKQSDAHLAQTVGRLRTAAAVDRRDELVPYRHV